MRFPCLLISLLLAGLLAACGATDTAQYTAKNITGVMEPLQLQLTGESGEPLSAADLQGKIVLMYFGYTNCPDVCPTTLAKLAQALKALGAKAEHVRILFVSVDPARDRPDVLRRYTAAFAPQVIGATGNDQTLTALTKRYRVAYRRDKPDAQGNYAVYHSSAVFVFDGNGKARLLITGSESAEAIAADLKTLLARSSG